MPNTKKPVFILLLLCFSVMFACQKTMPDAPEENEILDGPISGLTPGENSKFLSGDEAFSEVFTIEKGLGPLFVANQCSGCHAGDGKGTPFMMLTRFGQSDSTGNYFLNRGGPQLQHRAIPGHTPEKLPADAPSTGLIAPAVSGLGYLDAVSDADIINLSDPSDLNGDGISGRPHFNEIPSYVIPRPGFVVKNGRYLSRFGKKAGTYDLLQQTATAYNQDMGITSVYESTDTQSGISVDPEVGNTTIENLVFYLKTLKAPMPRNQDDADVKAGSLFFDQIGCGSCHIRTMRTGISPITILSQKEFHPYTDLLLHDMGPELDDGYTEGFALSSEWRTPALWGLGLSKNSQGGVYYLLHDGRANSIEEAILKHGGESEKSRDKFLDLTSGEKDQLIRFLESL